MTTCRKKLLTDDIFEYSYEIINILKEIIKNRDIKKIKSIYDYVKGLCK